MRHSGQRAPTPDHPLRDLSRDEVAAYERDGVICARGLFPAHWLERMAKAGDRVVAAPTFMGRVVSIPEKGFSGDLFLWKTDDDFRDFVYDSPAARIAQQVMSSERVNFFYDQLFVKPPGCHVPTPWHHDVTFWPIEGEQVCSLWMTLDRVSRETSGLEFVRGSHRWPNRFKAITPDYNAYMMDSGLEEPPDIDGHRDEYDLVCWDMEPGDVLIFNGLIVHGSSANYSTDVARRAFSSRFCGDGVHFAPRSATMPLLWDCGLAPGDPIGGSLFPRILPEPIAREGARRAEGPEPPDPELVARVVRGLG